MNEKYLNVCMGQISSICAQPNHPVLPGFLHQLLDPSGYDVVHFIDLKSFLLCGHAGHSLRNGAVRRTKLYRKQSTPK